MLAPPPARNELRRLKTFQRYEPLDAEAQLRLVTESARVGLVIVNADHRYEYANAAYADILGLPASDMVGQRVADVLPGVYEAQIRPRLDRAFAGERVTYELNAGAGAGDRQFAVRYEPRVVDGEVKVVIVVITDITEVKQTATATSRLAAIVEASQDAIVGMTLDGTFTSWNPAAERTFGYSAAEMIGSSLMRLVPADGQQEARALLGNVARGESVRHVETRRQTRDGRVIDVDLTVSAIRNERGTPIAAAATLRDITEAKRAEATVRNASGHMAQDRRSRARVDLVVLAVAVLVVFALASQFDWFEGVSQWIRAHEIAELDEILLAGVFLTVGLAVFALRRWREADSDLTNRQQVQTALTLLHDELDRRVKQRTEDVTRANSALRQEIAERRRAEEALSEREGQLRLYAEHSPAAIAMLDRDMRYVVVSRRWLDVYRLGHEPILGRSHYEIFPDVPDRWKEIHRRCLAGATERCEEDPFPRADGRTDWIRWEIRPWRRADGEIGGIIIFSEDITDRKGAEAAERATESRMRFALESAHVGIWDLDYTTGALKWSDVLESQYGFAPGTFPGTFEGFVDRVHPEDRAHLLETVGGAMKSGRDFTVLNRALLPNGKPRWLSGAGRIQLDAQGNPVRGIGISIDVTERRLLEEQYQQAQKMEAVGRLAGGVAHDFNNLLTAILGYAGLLLEDFAADDPRRNDVVEIQSAGRSAASLTRQLLAFSRKQIIEPTLLDLNTVVSNLRAMLCRLIGEDIQVVLRLSPEAARVKADHGQMEQVLMNLSVNARDAMPNGGTLTIETAVVELDEHYAAAHFSVKPGRYVALTVTDTGSGMTPEVQARLFEPFFTTKGVGQGTGLGLATVHGIAAHGGGSVNVYSEVGRGSSFKVYLPSAEQAAPEAAAVAERARPTGGKQTILAVDDADAPRTLAKRILTRLGYTVLVAADAVEATRLFEANPSIDVLLTDVVMPGASGPELTQRLIEQRPALKVIYMSGYTEEAIVHRGVLAPGVAFLHKPFTADSLGHKVRDVLDRPLVAA